MIPAIVLAAGKSSRMGRPKALLPVDPGGNTFLRRITETLLAAGVAEVVVVVGADAHAIRAVAGSVPIGVRLVENPDYEQGQLTSLLAGLRAVDRPGVSAAMVTLIDSPLVGVDTVRALIQAQQGNGAALIVRPVSDGRHGHPVIFASPLFNELRRADPAHGAKQVVRAHAGDIIEIPVEDEGAFIDIDTPEEYEKWIGRFPGA